MTAKSPSRTADRIIVRLPNGMRDQLAAKAKASGLTSTALVVRALERDLSIDHGVTTMLLRQRLEDTAREMAEAKERGDMLARRAEELSRSLDALGAFDVPPPDDEGHGGIPA